MWSRPETLINLTAQSPQWRPENWQRLVLYMGLVLFLLLLLILFTVIFSSWWRKVSKEKPKQKPAYTLEELQRMRKKRLISEAEYKTLRQKTLEEMEVIGRPTSEVIGKE